MTTTSAAAKSRFLVLEENVLLVTIAAAPNTCQILHGLLTEGARYSWHDGWIFTPTKRVRPATLPDFQRFGINPEPYAKDPRRYEMPTA